MRPVRIGAYDLATKAIPVPMAIPVIANGDIDSTERASPEYRPCVA